MKRFGNISLYWGRGRVLEPFLNRIYLESDVRRLIWVTPWMTHLDFTTGDTHNLIRKLKIMNTSLTVITREPEPGSEHETFTNDLLKMKFSKVYYLNNLHAKFYVCLTAARSYGMLGSANLYRWTKKSFEIGIVIEGKGEGEDFISTLNDLCLDIRQDKNCVLVDGGAM